MKKILDEILTSPQFLEGDAWQKRWYKTNEKVIEKGDIGNSLFLLEEGLLRVLGGAEVEGKIKVNPGLCDLDAGALFGDICLYGDHRRTASVITLTDACIIEIRSDRLSEYLDNQPAQGYLFLKALFKVMSQRVELANERIENLLAWGIKAHDIDKYL
jgi:CRP/FNR family transcriptional regulator, cyclic AMP receptor protein